MRIGHETNINIEIVISNKKFTDANTCKDGNERRNLA